MAKGRSSFEFSESDYLDVPLNSVMDLQRIEKESGLPFNNDSLCVAYFRHDDLKQMLDSNRDNLKLEAMKRIIGVSDFI